MDKVSTEREYEQSGIIPPNSGNPFQRARLAGSRVMYLEKDGTRSATGQQYRTKLKIDFAPYCDVLFTESLVAVGTDATLM